MQGLPFDDADFNPSSVPVSSSWIESSAPQIHIQSNQPVSSAAVRSSPQHPNHPSHPHLSSPVVTDEELYRIVTANPPINSHPSSSLHQSQPLHASPANPRVQSSFYPSIYASNQPAPSHHAIPSHSYSHSMPSNKPTTATPLHLQPTDPGQRHSNYSTLGISPPVPTHQYPSLSTPLRKQTPQFQNQPYANAPHQMPAPAIPTNFPRNKPRSRAPQQSRRLSTPAQPPVSSPTLPTSALPLVSPRVQPSAADTKRRPRAVRSAVDEARLRAQREAETYAHSRRDGGKREVVTLSSASGTTVQGAGSTGSAGAIVTVAAPAAKLEKRKGVKRNRMDVNGAHREGSLDHLGNVGNAAADDSEAEKQERYQRRLDMNRESAAVSRVRRRAYVRELEERLAVVEAEKFQLEGKLEIMMSQNESFKRQLTDLFAMVANGQRPVCPPGVNDFSLDAPNHSMGTSAPGMALNTNSGSGGQGQTIGGNSLPVHVQSQGLDST